MQSANDFKLLLSPNGKAKEQSISNPPREQTIKLYSSGREITGYMLARRGLSTNTNMVLMGGVGTLKAITTEAQKTGKNCEIQRAGEELQQIMYDMEKDRDMLLEEAQARTDFLCEHEASAKYFNYQKVLQQQLRNGVTVCGASVDYAELVLNNLESYGGEVLTPSTFARHCGFTTFNAMYRALNANPDGEGRAIVVTLLQGAARFTKEYQNFSAVVNANSKELKEFFGAGFNLFEFISSFTNGENLSDESLQHVLGMALCLPGCTKPGMTFLPVSDGDECWTAKRTLTHALGDIVGAGNKRQKTDGN